MSSSAEVPAGAREPKEDEMPADASAQLAAISRRLNERGMKGVKREMTAALRSCTVFLEAAVREAADRQLPHSGGLNRQQANQVIRIIVLTTGRNAGVRMRTTTRGSMQTDKGFVRHPVFGEWLEDQPSQQIPQATGWWSQTLARKSRQATPMILTVMAKVARQIQTGA